MAKHSSSFVKIFIQQFIAISVIIILISGTTMANGNYEDLRLGIAHPKQIPLLHDFNTPTIIPGDTGILNFTLKNRYFFNDNNTMSEVALKINIYKYVSLETSKDIDDVSHPPEIIGGNDALQSISDKWTAVFYWESIHNTTSVPVEIKIKSFKDTEQERYFVRMQLSFLFNGTYFNMKSRGHFSNSQWDQATMNITDQEGYVDERFIVGRIDLNGLGNIDGLLPDTSFRVLEPIPLWPLFVLVGFAVLFIILAIIFYLMDEKNKFPKTKKKLDGISKKVNDFRYRRS